MFIHTQVPAILLPDLIRRIPTVVSLDATPIQYDELGEHYGHTTGSARIEHLKWRMNRACFAAARSVVTWAAWTKQGLVDRYEVPAEKIVVIPPGVDVERWSVGVDRTRADGAPVRVLFVGGDLARKGGHVLVDAVRRLRHEGVAIELDLVTKDDIAPEPGVEVHHGLGPNSARLIELYQHADIFCLPTFGDCLPMVLSEAGAVGLPLVSTDVGAISEIVRHECTGLLVPPHDSEVLAAALGRLAADEGMRRRLGGEARRLVSAEFDAAANARRLVEMLVDVADKGRDG
jgi:glycosyltransferase involved in cell wall biosynthesis